MVEADVNLYTCALVPKLSQDHTVIEMLWEVYASVIILKTSQIFILLV